MVQLRDRMKVVAVECKDCNSIIFSRSRHDCRSCICGNISIDGGRSYVKLTTKDSSKVGRQYHLTISIPNSELVDDYYNNSNKYGLIKSDELEYTDYISGYDVIT